MNDVVAVLILSFIGSILGLSGGIIFVFNKSLRPFLNKYSIPFAAGILITVSIMGVLPEAVHMAGDDAYRVVLFTFIGAYLFEHLFFGIHHHDHGEKGIHYDTAVPLVIIGDTIHNFIDGVAISATYLANPGLGIITAISTFLHEVPHEVGDFGILLKSGFSNKMAVAVNVFSAAATFIGALLVVYYPQSDAVIGILLAIAAGLFLYLGATDFLPHIYEESISKYKDTTSLIVGAVLMVIMLTLIPHADSNQTHNESAIVEQKIPTGSLKLESY